MPQAVERIRQAIKRNELIAVYGDYDVDGVTATALLGTFSFFVDAVTENGRKLENAE